jgi:hypothetical protein
MQKTGQQDLLFVRREGIFVQRGNAVSVIAFPPPSLGVSSLELGPPTLSSGPLFFQEVYSLGPASAG